MCVLPRLVNATLDSPQHYGSKSRDATLERNTKRNARVGASDSRNRVISLVRLLVYSYLSKTASFALCVCWRVKVRLNLQHYSQLVKNTCVRQVV